MTQDLSNWFTKKETAERLGVSFKTIEKWVKAGKLQSAKRKETGKVDATVYHPDDVKRLEQERERDRGLAPFMVPAVREVREEFAKPSSDGAIVAFVELLREVREHFANTSQVRLFLSLKEASQWSGLPQSVLKEWIRAGKLPALKTGRGWRIRRKDLEGM